MRETLAGASAQGLDPKALIPPGLDRLLDAKDSGQRLRGERLLKSAVLRYARQVHAGRLAASDFDEEWDLRPQPFDPRPGLEAALAQDTVAQWLADLPPKQAGYQALVKQLAAYRALADNGGWKPIPGGRKLTAGEQDARVVALRQRLALEDASVAPSGDDLFDPSLTEALKAYQRRHGLTDDGQLGPATLAALNVPIARRIAQITANLERWRWLPDLPADRVDVNIAGAMTTLVRDGKVALAMRAAPGRKTDHTPMLASVITAIVVNPPWNIPDSIAEKEILPKAAADPGYLESEDIQVIDLPDGRRRLQQRAGPKSSLGQVKFEFDNPFGVYLHDTPAKVAFDHETRMVSHGCVRLEKPKELAAQLLQGEDNWSAQALDMAIGAGETRRVSLDRPMPVFLFYWTAYVGPDGRMIFYPDAYGWDQELLDKIGASAGAKA
ncbi:MAG TPA: L,D-transpeptidase family protein [Caulobacteraceae bacterium]|nr:L,D-transpeptidase family protein [Caulobacteraceae bacterium]